MKKTFVKAAFIAVVALVAGTNAHRAYCKQTSMSDIVLANIEALTDSSEFVEKKCTRATALGNCYDSNHNFVCTYIKSVEEYTVTNMLQICRYDKVTTCPSGTTVG